MSLQMIVQISLDFKFLAALVAFVLVLALVHFDVHRVVVTSQIVGVGKLLVALLATNLRLVGMHDLFMLLQTNCRMEELIAQLTLDLLLEGCVHLHVLFQVLIVFELLETFGACHFGFQWRVDVQNMAFHVMSGFERHGAENTRVSLDLRVLEMQVSVQI